MHGCGVIPRHTRAIVGDPDRYIEAGGGRELEENGVDDGSVNTNDRADVLYSAVWHDLENPSPADISAVFYCAVIYFIAIACPFSSVKYTFAST
jgi:hypothetical protein